jgi:MFS family permease
MLRVIRQRNFALLWTAGMLSLLGDWAFYTIMPVFVLHRTGSVFLAGSVWAVIALPSVVLGPFAGVFADRWDRRRVLMAGNCVQALAASILALAGNTAGVWFAMSVLLVNASFAALLLPAENALLPSLVSAVDLGPANALNAMNDNLGRVIGPPIGALLYARMGLDAVAVLDAVTFLAAALLVRLVRPPVRQRAAHEGALVSPGSIWSALRAGVEVVMRHRLLGACFLVGGLVAFADGPLAAMIPPFIDTSLGKGAEGVGIFATVRGVAGILGAVVIGRMMARIDERRLLIACTALNGLGFAAIALAGNFLIACVILLIVIGPTHIGLHTTLTTLVQRGSDDAHRGRVFALLGTVTGALFLIGTLGGSAAGASFSPAVVIAGSGLFFVLAAGIAHAVVPRESKAGGRPLL